MFSVCKAIKFSSKISFLANFSAVKPGKLDIKCFFVIKCYITFQSLEGIVYVQNIDVPRYEKGNNLVSLLELE